MLECHKLIIEWMQNDWLWIQLCIDEDGDDDEWQMHSNEDAGGVQLHTDEDMSKSVSNHQLNAGCVKF